MSIIILCTSTVLLFLIAIVLHPYSPVIKYLTRNDDSIEKYDSILNKATPFLWYLCGSIITSMIIESFE